MNRWKLLLAIAFWFASEHGIAQMGMPNKPGTLRMVTPAPDTRKLLKISPEGIDGLRSDMRGMLTALANALDLLASGKRAEAGKALEEGIGMSAMSTHPGMMRVSREMPPEARMLGMQMHQAASELARGLDRAKPDQIFAGLQRVVGLCATCHLTYRVR
jgi:hypothetical protein